MALKVVNKSSKKSFKGTNVNSTVTSYEKRIKEQANIINTLTYIPLSNDTYVLGPIRKTLDGADNFPCITSEEELDLNFWFEKNRPITT